MNNLDGTAVSRRVVLDAEALGYTKPVNAGGGANGKRLRRKRRRRSTGSEKVENKQRDIDNINPISMELQPLIKAAVAYGRKTHALGAMKAASALSSIVNRLKALEDGAPEISEIVKDAEIEASTIRTMLCESYEA